MTPSEFRDLIENAGDSPTQGVRVQGLIKLRSMSFTKRVELQEFTFEERVDFEDSRFAMSVQFSHCVFLKGLVLRHARFEGPLTLRACELLRADADSPAAFQNLRVKGQIDFRRLHVAGDLEMPDLYCEAGLLLNGARIDRNIIAESAFIQGALDLGKAEEAVTNDSENITRVEGSVNLSQSFIGSQVTLTTARVGAVNLEQCKIGGTIFCYYTKATLALRADPAPQQPLPHVSSEFGSFPNEDALKEDRSEKPVLGSLTLFGASVNGNIELKKADLKRGVNLSSAEIRGNVIIEDSILGTTERSSLRMADVQIRGVAQFINASFTSSPEPGSDYILWAANNATVGVLELDEITLESLEELHRQVERKRDLLDFTGIRFSDINFRPKSNASLQRPDESWGEKSKRLWHELNQLSWEKCRLSLLRFFCRTHCEILSESRYVRLLELSRLDERIYANVEGLLRRRGNDGQADSVFLRLRSRELPNLKRKPRKILNWFLLHSCGFGLVIRWFAAVALLTILINVSVFFFNRNNSLHPTPLPSAVVATQQKPKAKPGRWDAFWTIFRIEIPLLSASAPKEWEPSRGYKTWAAISTMLNWLVIPVIVASLSGLWKRRSAKSFN